MAGGPIDRLINVFVKTGDSNKQLNDLSGNLSSVDKNATKVTKSVSNLSAANKINSKAVVENGGAMGLLNDATGGVANTFKDAFEATGLFTKGLTGVKGAIIATGIGALVVIISELIGNWSKWVGLIDGSTAAIERLNKAVEDQKNFQLELNDTNSEDLLNLEEKIRLMKAEGKSYEEISAVEDELSKKRVKQAELALYGIEGYKKGLFDLRVAAENTLNSLKESDDKYKETKKTLDGINASIAEQVKIKKQAANDPDVRRAEEETKKREKAEAEAEKRRLEYLANQKKAREAEASAREEYMSNLMSDMDKEIAIVKNKFNKQIEFNKKYNVDSAYLEADRNNQIQSIKDKYATIEIQKIVESQRRIDEILDTHLQGSTQKEIDANYNKNLKILEQEKATQEAIMKLQGDYITRSEALKQERYDKYQEDYNNKFLQDGFDRDIAMLNQEQEIAKERATKAIMDETELQQELDEIDDYYSKLKRQRKLEEIAFIADSVSNSTTQLIGAIQSLNETQMNKDLKRAGDDEKKKDAIRRKAFESNKKLQIASAIISGISGAINAYTSLSNIPIVGPILGGIAAAAAAAVAIANVAKIKSTTYESSSGTADSGAGGASTAVPQFNIVGQSSENAIGNSINNAQQTPIKAYVVGSDVSTQQALDRNRVSNSTFL